MTQINRSLKIEFPNRPLDESSIVWRYLSLSKFESLINSGALYFTHPSTFSDQDEGAITPKSLDFLVNDTLDQYKRQTAREDSDGITFLIQSCIAHACFASEQLINCWTLCDSEDVSMWERYTPDSGVAIRSTVSKLKANLLHHGAGIFPIEYIAHETCPPINPAHCYLYKRCEYSAEREIRAAVVDNVSLSRKILETVKASTPGQLNLTYPKPIPAKGRLISVDLNSLIDVIILHPKNSVKDNEKINTLITHANLQKPVNKSALSSRKARLF